MKTAEREKLCINCEGRIPTHAAICPFCASDQNNTKANSPFQAPLFQPQTLEDSLASLYTPPYQGKRPHLGKTEQEPFSMQTTPPIYKEPILSQEKIEKEDNGKSSIWPSLFLTSGANFFILGLMQLFFSKDGLFTLQWDASYWFVYCILAAPLLFFGYKKLKDI